MLWQIFRIAGPFTLVVTVGILVFLFHKSYQISIKEAFICPGRAVHESRGEWSIDIPSKSFESTVPSQNDAELPTEEPIWIPEPSKKPTSSPEPSEEPSSSPEPSEESDRPTDSSDDPSSSNGQPRPADSLTENAF